jgi:hypothetical protein
MIVVFPFPAYAAVQGYPTAISAPAGAPIVLSACEASRTLVRGAVQRSTLNTGAAFKIVADQPATAVRIRFDYRSRAGELVGATFGDASGTFTPGVLIERTHRSGGDWHERRDLPGVASVVCVPQSVTFADGTSWEAAHAVR